MRPLTTISILILSAAIVFYAFKKFAVAETTPPQYQVQKIVKKEPILADSTRKTLRLMFVGDIMSQSQQIASAAQGDGSHNYTPCFRYIRPVLEQADLAFGNIECTLSAEPPFTGYPNFRSPDQLGEALRLAGFDILVTANNHSLDGGLYGVTHTLDVLKKNRFLTTGTFRNEQERAIFYPKIIYKNGFKIALLNATHHTNGYRTPSPSVVNRLDIAQLKTDIKKAQAMKPDFIITFLHWGDEHKLDEDANQRALARILHEAGSHLVVGAHPHVVQPIKNEQVTNDKKYLTAYSLGNFISAQPFVNTEGGIIFDVTIQKNDQKTTISDYAYIPVLRYTPYENGRQKYYALPVSAAESNEDALKMSVGERRKMANFARRVRAQLSEHGAQERVFSWGDLMLD